MARKRCLYIKKSINLKCLIQSIFTDSYLESSNDTSNGSSGDVEETTLAGNSTVGLNSVRSTRGRSSSGSLDSVRVVGGDDSRNAVGADSAEERAGVGSGSLADGNHAGEGSDLRALLDSGHDAVDVLAVPRDDLGAVGLVLAGERSRGAEVAGVGLGVLEEIRHDLGGGSGDALGEAEDGSLALAADVAEIRDGGVSCARLKSGALHDGVGHEVDVGRDGGGQEGSNNDGLHFD